MAEQLSLQFIIETPDSHSDQKLIYSRYRILDYLDSLMGRQVMLEYEDAFMSFRLPVEIGELAFSVFQRGLTLTGIHSELSSVILQHAPTTLCVDHDRVSATYGMMNWQHKGGDRWMEGLSGCTRIYVNKPYEDPCLLKRANRLAGEFSKTNITGKVVQAVVRPFEDWIQSVKTLPFVVHDVCMTGGQFVLEGSHGARLCYKGFRGFRHFEGYTIIDIRDPKGYMTRSFTLWHSKVLYT